jgi:hypothetical protein
VVGGFSPGGNRYVKISTLGMGKSGNGEVKGILSIVLV